MTIKNSNEIVNYIHCMRCLEELERLSLGVSPSEWQQIEVGFSNIGVQVWCKRHDCNILHIDFEGNRHPANTSWATEKS